LAGVSCLDVSHGCAVGYGGTVLTTSDGGVTWAERSSGTGDCLRAVAFPDATHGWAVGDAGTILHTRDGGLTWTAQDSGTTADLDGVCFVDASHGWAVGTSWTSDWFGDHASDWILATSDGGATWATQYVDPWPSNGGPELYGVFFSDTSHGWAVGNTASMGGPESNIILATTDGGTTWTGQSSTPTAMLYGVTFVDARHGWVVGDNGTILATTDGGVHWSTQTSGTMDRLNAAAFSDASHGWAVGAGDTILATTDGGAHWQAQTSGTIEWHSAVAFADATHGWVVGQGGEGCLIRATTSGGWSDSTPPTTTVSGADHLWHRHPVTLTFTASDNAGGSGVNRTLHKIGSGPWHTGTMVVIPAPANHANDGRHTVSYRSVDNAGNREAVKTRTVKIDTRGPVTTAPRPSTVVRGFWPALSYRAQDALSRKAEISIRISDAGGRTRHVVHLGWQRTKQTHVTGMLVWRCRLPIGTYRYTVLATDLAGNRESKVGSNRLIVT